jgi:hypothetical protein
MNRPFRIIFSYGPDEHLPVLLNLGSNLKEKNLFECKSEIVMNSDSYTIFHETIDVSGVKMDVFSTHTTSGEFIRGFVYFNGEELPITRYNIYRSLQIESYCYDNIIGVQIQGTVRFPASSMYPSLNYLYHGF